MRCKVHHIKMLTNYERINYEGAGFIFLTPSLELLLVKEKRSGKWGMCKGHREKKDDGNPTNTAMREAFEELSLTADDYEIQGEPFVMYGSPKIYVFQYALLHVDITTRFNSTIMRSSHSMSNRFTEIQDIMLMSYMDFIQNIDHLNSNVYVKLFHAYVTGTFVHSHKKPSYYYKDEPVTPPRSGVCIQPVATKPRPVFYNSAIAGGSPLQPVISPIIVPQITTPELTVCEQSFALPPLNLGEISTGRTSPVKGLGSCRDRAPSSNSLYEGSTSPRASPLPPYPFGIEGGGGGSGRISPRTCVSFLLPGSPSLADDIDNHRSSPVRLAQCK